MAKDFLLTILEPMRAAEFREVFGTDTVCVRSPVPECANLPGKPAEWIYLLDLDELTAAQRARLVGHLAAKFGYDPAYVDAGLEEEGMPILVEDTVVTVLHPQRWLS